MLLDLGVSSIAFLTCLRHPSLLTMTIKGSAVETRACSFPASLTCGNTHTHLAHGFAANSVPRGKEWLNGKEVSKRLKGVSKNGLCTVHICSSRNGGGERQRGSAARMGLGGSIMQEPWNQKVEKWSHSVCKRSFSRYVAGRLQ